MAVPVASETTGDRRLPGKRRAQCTVLHRPPDRGGHGEETGQEGELTARGPFGFGGADGGPEVQIAPGARRGGAGSGAAPGEAEVASRLGHGASGGVEGRRDRQERDYRSS